MSESRNQPGRLTRRRALKQIAGAAGVAACFPILGSASPALAAHSGAAICAAAGVTPYAPKFFNSGQLETIASLAEMIIPADEHSPGARAARVHEFIDTIIAESSKGRKDAWVKGLVAVDQMSVRQFQKQFARCEANQQEQLLGKISANEGHPATPEDHFFAAIKSATIEGYYTSAVGIHHELEYQGNTALGEFEGCAHLPQKTQSE